MTVSAPDATGVMKALANVKVTVYERDTTNPVKVYRNHDGTTQGPTVESGATGTNPFTTGATGNVEFWCDGPDEYDVKIEDNQAPARIATRTIGFNCMPAAPGSFPTSMLAGDAGLDLDALSAEIKRQMTQIGQIIDWWRPADSVPIPSGFEVCDGHQVAAGQHDFPGLSTSAINLPNLLNAFILGADPSKAFATAAAPGDAAANAPGVAGSGGSNAPKDLSHQHNVPIPNHTHAVSVPAHSHDAGTLYGASHQHGVNINSSAPINGTGTRATGNFTGVSDGHQHNVAGQTGASGSIDVGGATGNSPVLAATCGNPSVALAVNSATAGINNLDARPRYVGLIKLMKVRYS
jgi:hypothetical protein